MAGINFKGVEEAKERVMTRPGTIDVFDITEVKFDTTKNKGTYYMGVTFSRKADEFQHSFFLSEKALPRVVTLLKHAAGTELDSEVMEEKLIAMLKGKKVAMKVTAKFDEENGRAYADLSFGGFCKSPDKIKELAFTNKELELNKRAEEVFAAGTTAKPEGAHKPATSSEFEAPVVAPRAEEEIF